jgi:hypothetical protein
MAAIDDLKLLIEDDATDHGWTDEKLQALLDEGKSINRIAAIYWDKRAQQTIYLSNVSESGSSRSLDTIYPRMVAMAKKYADLADAEDAATPEETGLRYLRTYDIDRAGARE